MWMGWKNQNFQPALASEVESPPRRRTVVLEDDREVDFGRYGRSVLSRWWLVLLAIVAGAVAIAVFASAAVTGTMTPPFKQLGASCIRLSLAVR